MLINFIDKRKKEIFFLTLLVIFFYRSPYIFLNGRFMAEEGFLYFANAYKFGFLYSLLFVDFTSGYLNLWANIAGIISNLFDLKVAPLVSNYVSLIPKIFIIYLILYYRSALLVKFEHKVLFLLIVFLSPLNVPEIWLNSINSQIFFCIITFILIFINYENERINFFHLILIIFSGLTGIYSCILSPIFFFKYLITRNKQNLLNFISIFVCSLIQISLIFYGKLTEQLYEEKMSAINFDLFVNYIYNVFIKAFLGTSFVKYLYYNYINPDLSLYFISTLVTLLFFSTIFFSYYFLKNQSVLSVKNRFFIFSSLYCLIATSIVVMIGAVANYVGGRYAALPSFYLLVTVLITYILLHNFKVRYFFLIFLLIAITAGIYEFRPPTKNVKHQYIKFLDCIGCPDWEIEHSKFKKDNNYPLKIWPYPKKSMKLN